MTLNSSQLKNNDDEVEVEEVISQETKKRQISQEFSTKVLSS